jgi:hypothetical protein
VNQDGKTLGKFRIVGALYNETRPTVFNKGWNISDVRCYNRTPARHRFHDNVGTTFNIRSVCQKGRTSQETWDIVRITPKSNSICDSEVLSLLLQRFAQRPNTRNLY